MKNKVENKQNNKQLNIIGYISCFFKVLFKEFWNEFTINTSDRVSFELGGFLLCLGFTLGMLWLLGFI